MKIPKSGDYICKIVYNPSDNRYAEPIEDLLSRQPHVICKIHTRIKSRIWFHEVKKCTDYILKKHKLKFYPDKENEVDEYYDPFCGYIYIYNEEDDLYICENQTLKNTGGMKWNIYIKIYVEVK